MADLDTIQSMLQQLMDAIGAGEGGGAGYGYGDGPYGAGPGFSLYGEVLAIRKLLNERLDVPVSSREPAIKEPGPGTYVVSRIVKDDSPQHTPIANALIEARYSGTSDVIRSTKTNSLGKFVLWFESDRPVDISIKSDTHQGVWLYGVIPRQY